MLAAAVRALCSAGSQKQAERRLQDYSNGHDDRLVQSRPCAEMERKKKTMANMQTLNILLFYFKFLCIVPYNKDLYDHIQCSSVLI